MLAKYREVFYGLGFGLGAVAIDVAMHARMEDGEFLVELVHPKPAMLFYRLLFLSFGITLGWLLWQRSQREREFRRVAEILDRFQRDIAGPAVLMHSKLQVLLTHPDCRLSPEAEAIVRFVYETSQEIQSAIKEKLISRAGVR